MTFPDHALDVKVELKLGDTWTDITGHVYTRDPITITRGRQDEGSRADPATCSLTLNNKDGRYSPRNVNGPHYGLLGRNTPIRVSAGSGDMALHMRGGDATTPDTAALDITGDLDVRVDASLLQWTGDSGGLAGKYVEAGNQRSWIFWLNSDATLTLFWSTDGGNLPAATSTAAVPVESGRLSIRAALDADNGAAGRTVTFYTAPTLAGPWTQLGAPVVQAGVTSIFNSTSPLEVGAIFDPVAGRIYAAEVRDGIGGTVVASPDFTAQADGTTAFTDAAGRDWTVNEPATITNRHDRFTGEVPSWPVRWGPSGQDVHVQIEAAGITRRLGQGRKPLQSALYRSLASSPNFTAWWPLEEATGARRGASGYPGGASMTLVGDAEFTAEPRGGVGGGIHIDSTGRAYASVTGCPAEWLVAAWFDVPDDPGALPFLQWRTPGAAKGVAWNINPLGGTLLYECVDSSGVILFSIGGTSDLRNRGPVQVLVTATQSGSTLFTNVWVDGELDTFTSIINDAPAPVTSIGLNMSTFIFEDTSYVGTVSHIIVAGESQRNSVDSHVPAGGGYVGEPAATRVLRLCAEENIPAAVDGTAGDSEPMGPQTVAPFLNLLGDCEDADGGLLYEARDELALRYRPRTADYNTPAALTLDYHDQVAHPLEPVDDDEGTRNDVSVERVGGSSARVVVEDGPLSVQAPPDGVGIYDESLTVNVAADPQLLPIAGWRAHLGTVDEARYPVVRLKLHKHPGLIDAVTAMDVRSRVHLTGLPAWEPPGTVDLIADGYTEVLEPLRWTIEYNTVPGSPWRTGVLDDEVLGRIDTDGSALVEAVDADDTTLLVASTGGPYWTTDPAETPIDLRVGGEVVTVTAVGDGLLDAFDRTAADGWGTAPDGQVWSLLGNPPDYAVSGGTATIAVPARNAAGTTILEQVYDATDMEFTFTAPAVPVTGDSLFVFLIASYDPAASTWYTLRARLDPGGAMGLQIEQRGPGVVVVATEEIIPGLTVAAGVTYRIRFKVQGDLLRGKLWNAANPEPAAWHVAGFDGTLGGGRPGMQVFVPTANTNTLPVTFSFGELVLHNPQKLTVTRSVNGIAKPQDAGADIRLAQPSIIAL